MNTLILANILCIKETKQPILKIGGAANPLSRNFTADALTIWLQHDLKLLKKYSL